MGDTGFNMSRMLGGDPTGQSGFAGLSMDLANTDAGRGWEKVKSNTAELGEGIWELPTRLSGFDPGEMPDNPTASLTSLLALGTLGMSGWLQGLTNLDWGGMINQAGAFGQRLMGFDPSHQWESLLRGDVLAKPIQDIYGMAKGGLDILNTYQQYAGMGQPEPEQIDLGQLFGSMGSGRSGAISQIYNMGGEGGSDNIYGSGTDPKLMALIAALMAKNKGKGTIS